MVSMLKQFNVGRVAEWFKAAVLKTVVRESVPWVRIRPLPQNKKYLKRYFLFCGREKIHCGLFVPV